MATVAGNTLFVAGRLTKIAPPEDRRGHPLRARSGGRVLDSTMTDESGRFLLEWTDQVDQANTLIELLDSKGAVSEFLQLTRAELDSPPVVAFSGEGVVGSGNSRQVSDRRDRFEAEGCYPVFVASSCQEVNLSWTCPQGSTVSLLSGGKELQIGLPYVGSLRVTEARSSSYTRRTWLAGAGPDQFSDRTVEVRRYPSLSLVVYGLALWAEGQGEFGASVSCPAGDEGVTVSVSSSDLEMVPDFQIIIPPGLRWATTRVSMGSRKGVAKLTASAHGFAQDVVTFSLADKS